MVKNEYRRVEQAFKPFYDENSKILILGSLPSIKSFEQGFYYGNPLNRFWKVLSIITDKKEPITVDEKKDFLSSVNIALWDVIESCLIKGSSDSSIKEVTPADINSLVKKSGVKAIFLNGKTAEKYFYKYVKEVEVKVVSLPSTSPANAKNSLKDLIEKWSVLKEYL